jgi:hypothetical protein
VLPPAVGQLGPNIATTRIYDHRRTGPEEFAVAF